MGKADTLAGLAGDLRALSGRERRDVLNALSPFERAQAEALLVASAVEPEAGPDFSRFSPWLARHLTAPDALESGRSPTPATRRLLTQAAGELAEDGRPQPAPRSRSLAQAVGELFSPRRRP
jgi:hypothetical protein